MLTMIDNLILRDEIVQAENLKQTQYKDNIENFHNHLHVLFHRCAMGDYVEGVNILIEKYNFDINSCDNFGDYPLHTASQKNAPQIANLLIKAGANINQLNKDNLSPLHVAAKNHVQMIKLLVEHGADVNMVDRCGYPPLKIIFSFVCHHKLQSNLSADMKLKGLEVNMEEELAEITELFIKNGAKVNLLDIDENILKDTIMQKSSKAAKILIENGAKMRQLISNGMKQEQDSLCGENIHQNVKIALYFSN